MNKLAIFAGVLALVLGLAGCDGLSLDFSRVNGNQQAPQDQPAQ